MSAAFGVQIVLGILSLWKSFTSRSPRRRALQLLWGSETDGGAAAALAMVLAYHGRPIAQEALEKELWFPDGGTNAFELVQSARAHGLKARGVEVPDREMLPHLPMGSIVHRYDERFQVFEKIAGGRVTVLDPLEGRLTLPVDSFWDDFSNVAILFEVAEPPEGPVKAYPPLIRGDRR